ncbi:MAG TPA: (Fe-S)-binding protein, partial [Methanomassiliicoccales archaeon]|nr:(Fe-S)-binding protein [Methanomassiliicoccales archaeon]
EELKPRLSRTSNDRQTKVAVHQPCHLNRLVGAHTKDYSLQLLQDLPGVKVVEMESAEECCGAGGSLLSGYPEVAARMARRKVRHAQESGASLLLAACPFCVTNLRKAGSIEVQDLTSFIRSRFR